MFRQKKIMTFFIAHEYNIRGHRTYKKAFKPFTKACGINKKQKAIKNIVTPQHINTIIFRHIDIKRAAINYTTKQVNIDFNLRVKIYATPRDGSCPPPRGAP